MTTISTETITKEENDPTTVKVEAEVEKEEERDAEEESRTEEYRKMMTFMMGYDEVIYSCEYEWLSGYLHAFLTMDNDTVIHVYPCPMGSHCDCNYYHEREIEPNWRQFVHLLP